MLNKSYLFIDSSWSRTSQVLPNVVPPQSSSSSMHHQTQHTAHPTSSYQNETFPAQPMLNILGNTNVSSAEFHQNLGHNESHIPSSWNHPVFSGPPKTIADSTNSSMWSHHVGHPPFTATGPSYESFR